MRMSATLLFCALAGALAANAATTRADVVLKPTYVAGITFTPSHPDGETAGGTTLSATAAKGLIPGYGDIEDRAIFNFSLDGVTLDSNFSAHFRPYGNKVDNFSIGSTPASVVVYGYKSNGTVQVSYSTPDGASLGSTLPVTSIGYLDFDVTGFVKNALDQGWANVGFLIVSDTYGGGVSFNGGYFPQDPVSELVIGTVPEPTSLGFIGLGVTMFLARSRRR